MSAVLGTFSDARMVRSRSVLQLVIEVPIEEADQAMKALGGFPKPSESRWVGIALSPQDRKEPSKPELPKGAARPFHELKPSAQAGIRTNDPKFQFFLVDTAKHDIDLSNDKSAADEVRERCGVQSRAEFDSQALAGERWRKLEEQYQAWLTDERYSEQIR